MKEFELAEQLHLLSVAERDLAEIAATLEELCEHTKINQALQRVLDCKFEVSQLIGEVK